MARRLIAACFLVAALLAPGSGLRAQEDSHGPSGGAEHARALEAILKTRLGAAERSLDLDLIMMGPDYFGTKPERVRFSPDGERIRFRWKRWDERETGTFECRVAAGDPERLDEPVEDWPRGSWDAQRRRLVFREGESLRIRTVGGEEEELLRTTRSLGTPLFDASGERVLFSWGDGVWSLGLDNGSLTQLIAFEKDDEEAEPKRSELERWHRDRQLDLFRVLAEKKRRQDEEKERRKLRRERSRQVKRWMPPSGWRRSGVSISPRGDKAVITLRKGRSGESTRVPDYVTLDGWTGERRARPKVGDAEPKTRLVILDFASGNAVPVDRPHFDDDAPEASMARWSPDGEALLALARSDDDTQLALLGVDPDSGASRVLHEVRDRSWVLWSFSYRPVWLGRTGQAVFVSEKSGWAQLYLVDAESGTVRQLTRGEYEISSVQPTPDGKSLYALASVISPHSRELVRIDLPSGEMTILSAGRGGREFVLGPQGRRLALVHSTGNTPWELSLVDLGGEEAQRQITNSPSPAFRGYPRWEDPEIVRFRANDGVEVPARIYRPRKALPGKPAVIFVHGAGYLQNVHHWWSAYYREYGFHHLLRDEGYTVLDVDYRGSAGYGAAWRTAIYGHMGGRDLDDFVDAAEWLVAHEGCSKERIGIYGGSYGGFITLMALFTKPGVFRAGAALRPVTDWAHYNDGYTSNILDDPLESPKHYALSSPINFAHGLRDHLLVCHGLLDDNVQVQDVFRLQQRLIELRKENWEVALYPLERHGFVDPASWRDEYGRIKKLFDRVLLAP